MKLFFYDLETTGFGYDKCAIIQLAGIMADIDTNNQIKPLEAINLKMRPRKGKMIDRRALEVNDFTIDELLSFENDNIAYNKFINFILKYVDKYNKIDKIKLCGYNSLHFDSDFLRQWFFENGDKYFGSYFWSDQIDVMSEASRYLFHYRPIINNFKLGNVASVLGIKFDESQLHDGLFDVKLTLKIFKKILDSGNMIMPFDEETAKSIFELQESTKEKYVRKESLIKEEDAWITI